MVMTTEAGGSDDMMVDINTRPLINVMLVLQIMFIITVPIQTHALKLQMRRCCPARRRLRPGCAHRHRGDEEGVGTRVKDGVRQRRGRWQVARDDLHLALFHAPQKRDEAVRVHGCRQAIVERLRHHWVVGDLAFAHQILGTGDLVGENDRQPVLSVAALELQRHLAAAILRRTASDAAAFQRQRVPNIASSRACTSTSRAVALFSYQAGTPVCGPGALPRARADATLLAEFGQFARAASDSAPARQA
jgi:hypothetical protein